MIRIKQGMLKGRIHVPPSKSMAHRTIIAAALSVGQIIIDNVQLSNDISATLGCIKMLGADIEFMNGSNERLKKILIDGIGNNRREDHTPSGYMDGQFQIRVEDSFGADCPEKTFYCGESGSTLRFIIPIALALHDKVYLTGSDSLLSRPLEPYKRIFCLRRDEKGMIASGRLKSGTFMLPGDISSQFVTGLMLALPLLDGDSRIIMTMELQSRPYVDLSIDVLAKFGIEVINNGYGEFIIPGNQIYKPCGLADRGDLADPIGIKIEGDYSQAAFWLVANALGSDIECDGLDPYSKQGDKAIIDIIKAVHQGNRIINVSEVPDLVPVLTVLCCFCNGESRIVNAGRLRFKESDRLYAITRELNKLGADITELDDGLIIRGTKLHGGKVYAHKDHRIAMSLTIAATRCDGDVMIDGHECVSKSYPSFFEDFVELAGRLG